LRVRIEAEVNNFGGRQEPGIPAELQGIKQLFYPECITIQPARGMKESLSV